jgi:hypothetical protein
MDVYSGDSDLQADGWQLGDPTKISVQTTNGRFGGGAVFSKHYNANFNRPIVMTGSTFIVQCAFKHTNLAKATVEDFLLFYNNSNVSLCGQFRIASNGRLRSYDSNGTLIEISDPGVIKDNVWQYLEAKIIVGDSGSIVARVDGTQVINSTGIDTKPGTQTDVDTIRMNGASEDLNQGIVYDDIIFKDGSGSLNNDFSGDRSICTLVTTGDDATANFSSQPSQSVGNTYLNVDDPIPGGDDGDSSYNYSSTPGHETLHSFEDLPVMPASIDAVKLTLSAKKSDGGARTMAPVMKADIKTVGTPFSPGTDYELFSEIWEQTTESSPGSWDLTKVNGILAGYKLVS